MAGIADICTRMKESGERALNISLDGRGEMRYNKKATSAYKDISKRNMH